MRSVAIFLVVSFYLAYSVIAAMALEYSVHPSVKSKNLTAILATGNVKNGDVERLRSLLRQLILKKHIAIYLASPGGQLYEGMRLGLYFHQNGIKTVVEGGRACASACALAFLGGTDNKGKSWRSSSTDSRLGFHAFKGVNETATSADQVQKIVADMLRYGKAVNAPIDLLIAGFSTPSQDIFWVSHEDICSLGIKLWSNDTDRFVCNK
jgi:hypothetical protein